MQALLAGFKLAANACGTKTGVLPSLYDGINCPGNDVQVQSISDIWIIVANVIRILMAMAGGLAVIFIIVGGLYYVTSAGDPTRIKRAKEIITQAITGLVVVFASYGVVTFIASRF
jgi:hypothetical protein